MFKKRRFSKDSLIFTSLIIFSLILFALDQGKFLTFFKKQILNFFSPILQKASVETYEITRPAKALINCQKNEESLRQCRNEALDVIGFQSQIIELKRENNFLRKALQMKKTSKIALVPAQVIGDLRSAQKSIIINIGQETNIKEGDAVVLPGYFLVGQISNVFERASQVTLITDLRFHLIVKGQKTRTQGLLSGTGTHLKLEVINYTDKPEIGEIFISAGINSPIPPGLVVGKLASLKDQPTAIAKTGWINPFADLTHLENVLVLRSSD